MDINEMTLPGISDEDLLERIGCFGTMWSPVDPNCTNQCAAQERCVYAMALKTLPTDAKAAGATRVTEDGTVRVDTDRLIADELAAKYDTSAQGIRYCLRLYNDPSMGLPVIKPNGDLTPSRRAPKAGPVGSAVSLSGVMDEAEAIAAAPEAPEEVIGSAESMMVDPAVAALFEKSDDGAPELVDELEDDTPAPVVTKKKVRKKKAVDKKVPVRSGSGAAPGSTIGTEVHRGGYSIEEAAEDVSFVPRFQADLEKNHAEVPMGFVYKRRERSGQTFSTTLTENGFLYNGRYFPTLYAVMLEIDNYPIIKGKVTGRMGAKRFFNATQRAGV